MSPADDRLQRHEWRLDALLHARGAAVDGEIARLLDVAQPLIASILRRHTREGTVLTQQDAEDIAGTIHVRLIARLRLMAEGGEEPVLDLERYVASLTYNAVNDHLRKAFPARARLRNRLRYALRHDERLALWYIDDAPVTGLREWHGSRPAAVDVSRATGDPERVMLEAERPTEALAAIFRRLGRPVSLDTLVACTAAIWNIEDHPAERTAEDAGDTPAPRTDTVVQLETREYLRALWTEIRALRLMQIRALLLNLRGGDSGEVTSLLVLTGVVPFDELAAALQMTPEELTAIWNELPFDDLRIAGLLGVTRQQVINLRKSARERLARRMSRHG